MLGAASAPAGLTPELWLCPMRKNPSLQKLALPCVLLQCSLVFILTILKNHIFSVCVVHGCYDIVIKVQVALRLFRVFLEVGAR